VTIEDHLGKLLNSQEIAAFWKSFRRVRQNFLQILPMAGYSGHRSSQRRSCDGLFRGLAFQELKKRCA